MNMVFEARTALNFACSLSFALQPPALREAKLGVA
jgi:hypothetical protein